MNFADKFRDLYDYCNAQDIQLTQKMKEARNHLSESYSVFLFGRAGEGKTTTAFRLAKSAVDDNIVNLNRCAIIYEPDDLKDIKSDDVELLLIDDIFGKHNADASKLTLWRKYFLTLQAFVSRKVRIIFGSRMHIYLEYKRELDGYDVFSRTVELNSAELTPEEKRYILLTQLKANDRKMNENDVGKCIRQKETSVGFPLCAQQFARDDSLFTKKSGYFAKPFKYCLEQNLLNIDNLGFIALLYVFYQGNSETDSTKIDENVLQHIAKLRGQTSISAFDTREKLDNFKGSYLKCIGKTFSFLHDTMYETVAKLHAERYPTEVIKHCTIDYLCQCMRLEKAANGNSIAIEENDFKPLAERCVIEVIENENARRLSIHPMFGNEQFVQVLISVVSDNEDTFKDFFCKGLSFKDGGIHAFLYHILENSTENCCFFQEARKHLCCSHFSETPETCWKCNVKSEALSAICSLNRNDLYTELRADNAEVTALCLYKAVQKTDSDPGFVKIIISDLKESGKYLQDNQYLQFAIGISLKQQDKQIFNILKESGIRLTTKVLSFVVEHGTSELLYTILQQLVKGQTLVPDDMYTSRAITAAHSAGKTECLKILTDAGAKLTAWSVYWAIIDYGFDETAHFIKTLKENDTFDPEAWEIAWSMAVAMNKDDKKIYQLLKEEGVISTCHLVYALTETGHDADGIARVIEECKLTGRWNPEHSSVSKAYTSSRQRAYQKLTDMLVKHGAGVTTGCLFEVVMETNTAELDKVVKTLKDTGKFDPSDDKLAAAFVRSFDYKDKTIYNKLVSEGLYLTLPCLPSAVLLSIDTLVYAIAGLKRTNRWKPEVDDALVALNNAYLRQDKTAYEILLAEGLRWKPRNLYIAVMRQTLHGLKLIIRELKRRGLLEPPFKDIKDAITLARSLKHDRKTNILISEGLCC